METHRRYQMKLTFSAFANKIVNEELELIQKALVIAHQHYASWGNFDDALKITKFLSEYLDTDGCLEFKNNSANYFQHHMHHDTGEKLQHGKRITLANPIGI